MKRILLLLLLTGGCEAIVDTNVTQCSTDADCVAFGNHPSCVENVCVDSGLGPDNCFFGEPQTQADFANQCTTAETFQFDNCARIGMCDAASLAAGFQVSAPPQTFGGIPMPINHQPTPTQNCADLGNVIYLTGSTNLPPLIKAVQPLLSQGNPPYTAVFAPQTSCKGAGSIYEADPAKHLIKNVTDNYAFYYDAQGTQKFCLLDAAGNVVDVGESDVYPISCGYAPTTGVAEYAGPIQAINFVVPSTSKQTAISAEAAHLVFAAGGDNGRTTPWTDGHYFFTRSSGTGTTQLPSRAIGLDPTKWWGIDRLSATNLVASMEAVDPNFAENTIGLLSSDFADKNRSNIRTLAFQQQGQKYGYLPDSNDEAVDKANVRDGHYPIWGAIHLVVATTNGVPSQAASSFITQFSVAKLDEELVAAVIEAGYVPACAMKVMHTTEVGPLTAYTPSFACGCFFDKQVNSPEAAKCQTCTTAQDCGDEATMACNYGYCEKK